MNIENLENQLELLPEELKEEAASFIDFLYFKSKQKKDLTKREAGFLYGKISTTEDFNDEIEEEKEYMI